MEKKYELLIKKPIVTEKTTELRKDNKFVFEVDKTLNKIEIKSAIEKLFSVHVNSVKVINVRGKKRRLRKQTYGFTSSWKKAIITLNQGETFEFFEA